MTDPDPFFPANFGTRELYVECNFWTLETLVQKGLMNTNQDKMSRRCQGRAYDAITGMRRYLIHVSVLKVRCCFHASFRNEFHAHFRFDFIHHDVTSRVSLTISTMLSMYLEHTITELNQ